MIDVLDTHRISVHTPIEEFVHPDTGSVIEVVSTMHVGEPQYYNELHNHLRMRARDGFQIGEEAIREPTIAELQGASAVDLNKLKLLKWGVNFVGLATFGVEDSPSFTHQYEFNAELKADPLIPEVINTDMRVVDIVRGTSYAHLALGALASYKFWKVLERAHQKGPEAYDQAIYDVIVSEDKSIKAKQQAQPKSRDRVMVNDRNSAVLAHVDDSLNENPATKIALVWGYGHRQGLVDGVTQRGYRPSSVSYKTVAMNPAILR